MAQYTIEIVVKDTSSGGKEIVQPSGSPATNSGIRTSAQSSPIGFTGEQAILLQTLLSKKMDTVNIPLDRSEFKNIYVGKGLIGGVKGYFRNKELNELWKKQDDFRRNNPKARTAQPSEVTEPGMKYSSEASKLSLLNAANSAPVIAAKYGIVKTASYVYNNIGKFTGDSTAQSRADLTMKILGYGVLIAKNPVVGIMKLTGDFIQHSVEYNYQRVWDGFAEAEIGRRTGVARYGRSRGGRV
jgi:hypothetical protein